MYKWNEWQQRYKGWRASFGVLCYYNTHYLKKYSIIWKWTCISLKCVLQTLRQSLQQILRKEGEEKEWDSQIETIEQLSMQESIFIRTKNQMSDHNTWFVHHITERGTEEGRKASLALPKPLLFYPLAALCMGKRETLCLHKGEQSDCEICIGTQGHPVSLEHNTGQNSASAQGGSI